VLRRQRAVTGEDAGEEPAVLTDNSEEDEEVEEEEDENPAIGPGCDVGNPANEKMESGAFEGCSFESFIRDEPELCRAWLNRSFVDRFPSHPQWYRLMKYLIANRPVGSGKHKSSTFQEVLEKDPDYCVWVMTHASERYSDNLHCFKSFLLQDPRFVTGNVEPNMLYSYSKFNMLSKDVTFEQALEEDLEHCQFVARCGKPNMNCDVRFWEWCRKNVPKFEVPESVSNQRIGVGVHKDLTYQEALEKEPAYCIRFFHRARARVDPKPQYARFQVWLKENMPKELLHGIPQAWPEEQRATQADTAPDLVLRHGPHEGDWFSDVVIQHPDYCKKFCKSFRPETETDANRIGLYDFVKSVRPDLAPTGR
jgi:hypothetical protein